MVVFVQAFDELAIDAGGSGVMPLERLFAEIRVNPAAPEHWWAYALLFSTMIPSLINLMIGGASLVRGLPGIASWLLQWMPEGKVLSFHRHQIATVLTGQILVGAALGLAAQVAILIAVIGYALPWFGFTLLDLAQAVAAFDFPRRLVLLF
jgi:hypothetical protein